METLISSDTELLVTTINLVIERQNYMINMFFVFLVIFCLIYIIQFFYNFFNPFTKL